MKHYIVISQNDPNDLEESINIEARSGYVVTFFGRSLENDESVMTVIMEREIEKN